MVPVIPWVSGSVHSRAPLPCNIPKPRLAFTCFRRSIHVQLDLEPDCNRICDAPGVLLLTQLSAAPWFRVCVYACRGGACACCPGQPARRMYITITVTITASITFIMIIGCSRLQSPHALMPTCSLQSLQAASAANQPRDKERSACHLSVTCHMRSPRRSASCLMQAAGCPLLPVLHLKHGLLIDRGLSMPLSWVHMSNPPLHATPPCSPVP